MDVCLSVDFLDLKGISDLAQNMVETKKGYRISFGLQTSNFEPNFACCDNHVEIFFLL